MQIMKKEYIIIDDNDRLMNLNQMVVFLCLRTGLSKLTAENLLSVKYGTSFFSITGNMNPSKRKGMFR